jgi:hypothetical protein
MGVPAASTGIVGMSTIRSRLTDIASDSARGTSPGHRLDRRPRIASGTEVRFADLGAEPSAHVRWAARIVRNAERPRGAMRSRFDRRWPGFSS